MTTKEKTKKVSKVVGSKKASVKSPKKVKQSLRRAEGPQCFWVTDGQVLADVRELHRSLQEMQNEVFQHHVTDEKNDFADWVEFVLEDQELAESLRKSKQPETACTVISRRLKIYDV